MFFEDLLQEAKGRPMSSDKFEALTQNMGRWMYNYFWVIHCNYPGFLISVEFREYARSVAEPGENVDDIEQLVLMIEPGEKSNLMYDYLNQIPSVLKAQEIIKKVGETFETIGKRIKYYDRPDDYIPVRGRKPKEKGEKDIDVIDITKNFTGTKRNQKNLVEGEENQVRILYKKWKQNIIKCTMIWKNNFV